MVYRIGIIGSGPWVQRFHAPTFAEGPLTTLSGIWSDNPEQAAHVAARHGTQAAASLESLIDRSDALVLCVPPNVQTQLAIHVASAGKPLLLEKPLGLDLKQAQRVVDAFQEHGTVHQVMLSNRYSNALPNFLERVQSRTVIGAVATFVNDACRPGGMFATPWRIDLGSIFDLGPHVFDVLDAALGRIISIRADGDPRRFVTITNHHENGTVSQAALSLTAVVERDVAYTRVFTEEGELTYQFFTGANPAPEIPDNLRSQFVETISASRSHSIDVTRVLHLQKLIDKAMRSLRTAF